MKKTVYIITLVVLLPAIAGGCSVITGDFTPATHDKDVSPLSWLLRAVPATTDTIMYSDIPALSTGEGQAIPSRQASVKEKFEWWSTFQRYALTGIAFNGVHELWGFDGVDVQGLLTFWPPLPPITVLGGNLDTAAFREKMKSYRYDEENYPDYTVIYGMPQPAGDLTESMAGMMPRAFGVIDGLEVDGEIVNLIIMTGSDGADDPLPAKSQVETVLKAYRDRTTLAYGSGGITALADSLGKVGSAFLTKRSDLKETWGRMDATQKDSLKTAIGPGELSPYNEFAITYRREGDRRLLEFVLSYDSAPAAQANAATLRARLTEARSVYQKTPLADLWKVGDVAAAGSYLCATVELIPRDIGTSINLTAMIYALDYWFLYPD